MVPVRHERTTRRSRSVVVKDTPVERGLVVGSLNEGQPRQVITIHQDGSISGLVHKPGKGVEITGMGTAEVVRASEIVWDYQSQKWVVSFLTGPLQGKYMTWREMFLAVPDMKTAETWTDGNDYRQVDETQIVSFRTYELAVEAEIAYFNYSRLNNEGVKL